MKLFIVFAATKPELKAVQEEFKIQCSIVSSGNGWMNEELTLRWINEVISKFSFRKPLIAWDTYECHMTDAVKKQLHDITVESVEWCLVGAPSTYKHQMCHRISHLKHM